MAKNNTQRTSGASVTSIPSPIETGPIELPPVGGSSFFNDFRSAMHDYPEESVVLEIVDVEFEGTNINIREEGFFMVQLTNNGLLNMTDVTLKVRGLNGTLVKTGGAADFDWREDLTIEMANETIRGQGGVSLTSGSRLRFQAPAGTKPVGTELLQATIEAWNANLDRLLNFNSLTEEIAPVGTYVNEVVGD